MPAYRDDDMVDKLAPPPRDGAYFRAGIGLLAMLAAIGGFAALFFFEIPPRNENAIMFALGSVFGWAASVVGSEYGATTTGRRVAEAAVNRIESEAKTQARDADAARDTDHK